MSSSLSRSVVFMAGLAIFAMQFGAGNIVFALSIGQFAQDKNFFAIIGLLLSGVILPLLGLIAMTLFQGDYQSFFARIGKIPGFLVTCLTLSLLGPLGAIPRCIALAYSTSKAYLPHISLPFFSLCCCALIFSLTFRRAKILDVIGYFLTPLKLGSLSLLIFFGLFYSSSLPISAHNEVTVFLKGFSDGYQTMDLLGAFFFCSVVLDCLRKKISFSDAHALIPATIKASCLSSLLLAFIYLGFSYMAAFHSAQLENALPAELVSRASFVVLGEKGGLFVCFAVTLACLTTAVALSAVFAEFLHTSVSQKKANYVSSLLATLGLTYFISTLDFTGIVQLLTPLLQICYPGLIVLCLMNILYKLNVTHWVKTPVFSAFAFSLIYFFLSR